MFILPIITDDYWLDQHFFTEEEIKRHQSFSINNKEDNNLDIDIDMDINTSKPIDKEISSPEQNVQPVNITESLTEDIKQQVEPEEENVHTIQQTEANISESIVVEQIQV